MDGGRRVCSAANRNAPYVKAKVGRNPVQSCSNYSGTLLWGEGFPDSIDDILMLCSSCKRKPYLRI
jgi:hypothetical protein